MNIGIQVTYCIGCFRNKDWLDQELLYFEIFVIACIDFDIIQAGQL